MTNPKSDTPCLPGCRTIEAAHYDSDHVPSCPNAFRPNAEAHKCDCGADDFNARNLSEGDRRVPHALNCPKRPNAEVPKEMDMDLPRIGMRKPAPAPEPEQGSEDEYALVRELQSTGIPLDYEGAWKKARAENKALRARLAEEIKVRDESISDYARQMADIREHWHAEATENVELKAERDALRAEVERLRPAAEKWFEECATAHLNPPYHVATLQTDLAAERAAREKAEARVKELEVLIVNGGIKEMTEEARAILARAKEGEPGR